MKHISQSTLVRKYIEGIGKRCGGKRAVSIDFRRRSVILLEGLFRFFLDLSFLEAPLECLKPNILARISILIPYRFVISFLRKFRMKLVFETDFKCASLRYQRNIAIGISD